MFGCRQGARRAPLFALLALSLGACSVQRLAMDSLSDVLASGSAAFANDNDPELVGDALPFTMKLIDGLLLEQPDHQGLLLAAARAYVTYAYAYISWPAERASLSDIDLTRELRSRARNLFLRAHDYASRALDIDYPGLSATLLTNPEAAVRRVGRNRERDVETLYWTAAALGLAISASRNEPELLARLPEVEALLTRALELDESWNSGSLHEVSINLASVTRADETTLRQHYERALELSRGRRAALYVTFAEAMAVPRQDRARFVELLDRALTVDVDAAPTERLANTIAQQRAVWLLSNLDHLFLE